MERSAGCLLEFAKAEEMKNKIRMVENLKILIMWGKLINQYRKF